tara:strand:- start:238 stop:417 length:180 start_codon:yes stop_codon:yes gene_type:complete
MSSLIEYEGYLWVIEKIKGKKVYLNPPHHYLVLNEKSQKLIVNKKDLNIIIDKKDNKNE